MMIVLLRNIPDDLVAYHRHLLSHQGHVTCPSFAVWYPLWGCAFGFDIPS